MDLVITDLVMPKQNGSEAIRSAPCQLPAQGRLLEDASAAETAALQTSPDADYVLLTYLLKHTAGAYGQNRIRSAERRCVTVNWRQVRFHRGGAGRRRARISADINGNDSG